MPLLLDLASLTFTAVSRRRWSAMIPYAGMSFLTHDTIGDLLRLPSLAPYTTIPNSESPRQKRGGKARAQLTASAELFSGALAGLISQTSAYPLEVIRRRMQVGGAVGDGHRLNMAETARKIWLEKGFRGFWVGLTIGYMKVVPMAATSFYVRSVGRSVGWSDSSIPEIHAWVLSCRVVSCHHSIFLRVALHWEDSWSLDYPFFPLHVFTFYLHPPPPHYYPHPALEKKTDQVRSVIPPWIDWMDASLMDGWMDIPFGLTRLFTRSFARSPAQSIVQSIDRSFVRSREREHTIRSTVLEEKRREEKKRGMSRECIGCVNIIVIIILLLSLLLLARYIVSSIVFALLQIHNQSHDPFKTPPEDVPVIVDVEIEPQGIKVDRSVPEVLVVSRADQLHVVLLPIGSVHDDEQGSKQRMQSIARVSGWIGLWGCDVLRIQHRLPGPDLGADAAMCLQDLGDASRAVGRLAGQELAGKLAQGGGVRARIPVDPLAEMLKHSEQVPLRERRAWSQRCRDVRGASFPAEVVHGIERQSRVPGGRGDHVGRHMQGALIVQLAHQEQAPFRCWKHVQSN
ncbi:hypothetical protein T310_6782 [Rasamsonia emersonii CBS 393.64]|uniref:Mitochondrial carrier protein n=1 Tax=Rasamsonia emersonii (strain ATCC 16479 / CBS 393.64 / IMI 116815) TaxID=1408163 RepID=A0A0F4YNN4_RASE3|nr:hypothetical protein T310_6782 [Rasamsonia emersonii CBS 393.64]KKA19243.1 hypothetical protein T310_6782 [Rasamsonia emersonii CBS 393.64]